jgi:hypothetical protein
MTTSSQRDGPWWWLPISWGSMEVHAIIMIYIPGWWCNNHLEKYEFVNGKDDIPYMKWKIKNVPNHQPDTDYRL